MSLNFLNPITINGATQDGLSLNFFTENSFYLNGSYSPQYQNVTVSGDNSVTLVNAKADGLNYVKAYGACKRTGTGDPSPTNIMPIICNNGQLKVKNANGLPLEYYSLDYVTNASKTRINTGTRPQVDDIEIEMRVMGVGDSWYLFQTRPSTSAAVKGLAGASAGSTIMFSWGDLTLTSTIRRTRGNIYYLKAKAKNGQASFYVKDETSDVEDLQTGTYTISVFPSTNFYLWGNAAGNNVNAGSNVYLLNFKIGGELVLNYIPAQNGNDVAGFYDTVTSTFIDTPTTGSMTGGSIIPETPVIYVDGTTETIKDSLNNTATTTYLCGLSTKFDEQNILSRNISRSTKVVVLTGDEDWSATQTATAFKADFLTNVSSSSQNPCICTHYQGSAASTSISSMGDMRCKIGANTASIANRAYIKDSSLTTATELKEYLSQQYHNGTPVIVVYGLKNVEVETTTRQTLSIQEGENVIEITQASIDPLKIEVSYKAGVEVTIEEVENANLDNSVTVTIS